MKTIESESKKTIDERASDYFTALNTKPTNEGAHQSHCESTGNNQTRTTQAAFREGWEACAQFFKGDIETAYTTGAADQKRIMEHERHQRWAEGNAKKVFTYADLKKVLDSASPEQLQQQARWWGEDRGGKIVACEPLEERYVNTGGDYMEPESVAREVFNEEHDSMEHPEESFEDTVESELPKGTLMMTDYTLE